MSPFICLRSSERDKSIYFWSWGSYSFYNATKTYKFRENVSIFAFRHFVYLVNSSAITPQNDSPKFATIAVHFVDKLFVFLSIVSSTQRCITMAEIDVTKRG